MLNRVIVAETVAGTCVAVYTADGAPRPRPDGAALDGPAAPDWVRETELVTVRLVVKADSDLGGRAGPCAGLDCSSTLLAPLTLL